jgi:tetratricopeptide (TPR) repeat protein
MTDRYIRERTLLTYVCSLLILLSLALPTFASGPHLATIVKHDGNRASGEVRYLSSSKAFELKIRQATTQIQASQVARVILKDQPAQLAGAIRAVNSGQYASAITVLKKIKEDYEMFGPDVTASQYLAVAYLKMGKADDAVRMCDEVIRNNPSARNSGEFAGIYWDALLKSGQSAKLRRILDDAVQSSSRQVAAVAQVKRGDIDMEKGEARKALVDGYLRVVLLFQDVESIQPEALFKAIKAHEALNENRYAEKWRKRLLSGYGNSEYAKKLK